MREAAEVITVALSLVAPYVAEEMWEPLGHAPSVASATWPSVDPALLVTESVTCVVQIQGKVRGRLEVPPDIGEDELRELALADEAVQRSLAGRRDRQGHRPGAQAGQHRRLVRGSWKRVHRLRCTGFHDVGRRGRRAVEDVPASVASSPRWSVPATVKARTEVAVSWALISTWSIGIIGGMTLLAGQVGSQPAPATSVALRSPTAAAAASGRGRRRR